MEEGQRDEARERVMRFGRRVKALRQAHGLSQEQLAHRAGFDRAAIGFIERGDREPGISKVVPLADALGVSVADLFTEDAVETPA